MKKSSIAQSETAGFPRVFSSFIAANGYRGFRSRFDEVYRTREYDRLFILKGGPGTGKSHAMRQIAKNAEKIGADCEYIYCSSDPDSLDGLILVRNGCRIGILDGTAPHLRCTEIPGAVDEIVNLGEFWNSARLSPCREKIFSLQQKKSEAYRRAYRYLRIAGEADAYLAEMMEPCIAKDKIERAVCRVLHQIPSSPHTGIEIRYRQACSMKGLVSLPIKAERTIAVSDYLGSARYYLSVLKRELAARNEHFAIVFPSCFTDSAVDSIYIPSSSILFTSVDEHSESQVNMKRFVDVGRLSLVRSEIRHLRNICRDMQEHALSALKEAGKHHFALEQIYSDAMNFSAKEDCISALSERIVGYLQAAK